MSNYIRWKEDEGLYFFTLATFQRRPLFNDESIPLFQAVYSRTKQRFPFQTRARCMLPDHAHFVWCLPGEDQDYGKRWSIIKREFGDELIFVGHAFSTNKRGERNIWQRRYREHTIRDETDYASHIDYVNFNPVKHGLLQMPEQWPYTSYHFLLSCGWYQDGWGSIEPESCRQLTERGARYLE
jgi:putative transposase